MTLDPQVSRREMLQVGATVMLAGDGLVGITENAMVSPESELKALLNLRSAAIGAKDLDRLMSVYSPEIVYFDIVPPLRYAGATALRARFADWFERWESAIGQQTHDVNILASGDVAIAHMLIYASGTLKTGRQVGYWVRVSNGCRRLAQGWALTHEHVSLPVDLASGRAVMDLVP